MVKNGLKMELSINEGEKMLLCLCFGRIGKQTDSMKNVGGNYDET